MRICLLSILCRCNGIYIEMVFPKEVLPGSRCSPRQGLDRIGAVPIGAMLIKWRHCAIGSVETVLFGMRGGAVVA